MMKRTLSLLLLASCALALCAQAKLAPSNLAPTIDGVIADKEYAWLSTGGGITLALALSADSQTLCAALSAPTAGWVAIGLGSLRMNKSFMVMGYDHGASSVTEDYGLGDRHAPANQKLLGAAVARKTGKLTTLEFAIPAGTFLNAGKLDLILAYGLKADFVSMHTWKTAFTVALAR
jgi:hypothetical protein